MTRIFVRWWPPYSNGYKEQPCQFEQEAQAMVAWFESIGVKASAIHAREVESFFHDKGRLYEGG